jgi:hypothetical protein
MKTPNPILTTILLALGCLGLPSVAPALVPPPDGGYGSITAEGNGALDSIHNGGRGAPPDNTALGYNTLFHLTTGEANTAVGSLAMFNNNGNWNTAIGYQALHDNMVDFNTAVGAIAKAKTTNRHSVNFSLPCFPPLPEWILEREIKRVPKGRAIVILISDKTRGHGSHTIASLWKGQLLELLKETEPSH